MDRQISKRKDKLSTLVIDLEKYENWSDWSPCHHMDCSQSRVRNCLGDIEDANGRNSKKKPCPHIFIKEKIKCNSTRECQAYWSNRQRPPLPGKSALFPPRCGIQPKRNESRRRTRRIVGGHESMPNNWPWHAGLLTKFDGINSGEYYPCGATLIHPQWAVTAAHCISEIGFPGLPRNHLVAMKSRDNTTQRISPLWIRIGDHDRVSGDKDEKDAEISHVILHPRYSETSSVILNDQALLRLTEPVTNAHPVCLPSQSSYRSWIQQWTDCYVVGWGQTKAIKVEPRHTMAWLWDIYNGDHFRQRPVITTETPTFARRLQQAKIPLASLNECGNDLRVDNLNSDIHVCAGSAGVDTCHGDSGGGLFCRSQSQQPNSPWYLIAVTSFGAGCGHYRSVYAKMDVDWIRKTILT